jgi:hypothetical protein
MTSFTPSTALPLITVANTKKFDRDHALFEEGNLKSTITVDRYKINRKPFSLTFDAVLDCDRILVNQFDGKTSFSLYVIPESEEDCEAFENFNSVLEKSFKLEDKEWQPTSSWRDDRLHLKIKYTPGTLQSFVSTDISLNLKKPHEFKIAHGQKVRVTGSLSYYYNFDNSMFGTTFNPSNLQFTFEE